jgi:hypothetical protein
MHHHFANTLPGDERQIRHNASLRRVNSANTIGAVHDMSSNGTASHLTLDIVHY